MSSIPEFCHLAYRNVTERFHKEIYSPIVEFTSTNFNNSDFKAMGLASCAFGGLGLLGALMLKHHSPKGVFTACGLIPGLVYLATIGKRKLTVTPSTSNCESKIMISLNGKIIEISVTPWTYNNCKSMFMTFLNEQIIKIRNIIADDSKKLFYPFIIYPTAWVISNIFFNVNFRAPMVSSVVGAMCVGPILAYMATTILCITYFQTFISPKTQINEESKNSSFPSASAIPLTPQKTNVSQAFASPQRVIGEIIDQTINDFITKAIEKIKTSIIEGIVSPFENKFKVLTLTVKRNIYTPQPRAVVKTSALFGVFGTIGAFAMESRSREGVIMACSLAPVIMSLFMSNFLKPCDPLTQISHSEDKISSSPPEPYEPSLQISHAQDKTLSTTNVSKIRLRYSQFLDLLDLKDFMFSDSRRVLTGLAAGYPITFAITRIFSRVPFAEPLIAPTLGMLWITPMLLYVAGGALSIAGAQWYLSHQDEKKS